MNRSIATILLSAALAWPQPGASAAAGAVTPAVQQKARPIPLRNVRLTGGPLKQAQDRNAAYLLSLSSDRMMAFLRKAAGLEPKAAGLRRLGWGRPPADRPHRRPLPLRREPDVRRDRRSALQGAGGLSRLRAQGRAGQARRRLYRGPDRPGQDAGQGPLRPGLRRGNIRSAGFDLNGMWSPWYVQHKIFAGLRDAYRFAGNRKALEVETRSRPGRKASFPSSTTPRSRRCSAPSSAA